MLAKFFLRSIVFFRKQCKILCNSMYLRTSVANWQMSPRTLRLQFFWQISSLYSNGSSRLVEDKNIDIYENFSFLLSMSIRSSHFCIILAASIWSGALTMWEKGILTPSKVSTPQYQIRIKQCISILSLCHILLKLKRSHCCVLCNAFWSKPHILHA